MVELNPREILKSLAVLAENKRALLGSIILLSFVLMALVGPLVVPLDLNPKFDMVYAQPSLQHPLGCDYIGIDILAQIIWGARDVLTIVLLAGVITVIIGTIVGLIAGYFSGAVDLVLNTLIDIVLTIPGLPLVIVLAGLIQTRDPVSIGLILSANAWAWLARAIRSQVLTIKERDFIEASKAMGIGKLRIVFSDILPILMPYIGINFLFAVVQSLYASVALFFIGVLPFSTVHWGTMLNIAMQVSGSIFVPYARHYVVAPIIFIVLLQVGLILFSYGIEDIFNPRLKT
ncbi:MAG: ABC transporter permease [Thermoproteota archaeon]